MKLKIHFDQIEAKDKLFLEGYGKNCCTKVARCGAETVLTAEGTYEEMLNMIMITSCYKHKKLILQQ